MLTQVLIFGGALTLLLIAAKFFTDAAERIGNHLRMPPFVVGIFIVGIGTSLPELVSAIISVRQSVSEIVPGNIIGANVANILLITGITAFLNKKDIVLSKFYIFIDLHYMMGSFLFFAMIAYDGVITWKEAIVGILGFIAYSFYLINDDKAPINEAEPSKNPFPIKDLGILLAAGTGIFFGAEYTVAAISSLAEMAGIPPSIIALTLLSLGTTLPELAVNISAIRKGKAEMAVGNVLGSSLFNAMVIPGVATIFGEVHVPDNLLHFSLPCMIAFGVFFYMLVQDKKISRWEGILFLVVYLLFMLKVSGVA